MKNQRTYEQNGIILKNPRVVRSEQMFNHIADMASKAGLVVNAAKTNLLVISAAKSYHARAHFYDRSSDTPTRVDCGPNLKALGFTFNECGDCSTQVNNLCTKFRKKVWSLRHLRKSGFTEEELLAVYKSYIRPTIEYSLPIYHPMLTGEQQQLIEKQQFFALRNIYGFMYSNRKLLELSNIKTLKERRQEACLKFAQKTANNGRFQHWFPKRTVRSKRHGTEEYVEMAARTDRRKQSPIFYYRRLLNESRINYDTRTNISLERPY